MDDLASQIAGRFGAGVAVEVSAIDGREDELRPEELASIQSAKGKRRAEFITGRRLARRALARLGARDLPLPSLEDRRPAWPDGFLGSISHTKDLCVVVAAPASLARGIGVDVEVDRPLKPDLFRMVLTEEERARIDAAREEERGYIGLLHFSAKECFYKAQYGLTQTFLEFEHVTLDLLADRFSVRVDHPAVRAQLPPALSGFTLRGGGWVVAGMLIP